MTRACLLACAAALGALLGAGCGDDDVAGAFTSRVVQRDICRVVGTRPEVCTRDEASFDLRVQVVDADDEDHVWLYGIPRNGVSDRAILGTRDSRGGFLFVDELVQDNAASGCTLTDRIEISVAPDPGADPTAVGLDPCVALVGRETEVTVASAGCDTVNVPPLESTLTARRRWEKPPECAP